MRSLKLGLNERARLHRTVEAVYARLIAKSGRFQPIINGYENGAVSIFTLGLIAIGLAGGAAAGYFRGEQLAELTGLQFLTGPLGPVSLGAIGAVLVYFFFDRLGRLLSKFPLFQQMAEIYVFNTKWLKPKTRMQMTNAALTWLQRQPEMVFEATGYLYGSEDGYDVLPKKLQAAADEMREGDAPVVCMREVFERKLKSEYLFKGLQSSRDPAAYQDRYFIQSRAARNGIRASLLFNALGCELRDEIPTGDQWRRAKHTDHQAQLTTIRDNHDVTLRFRTGAPHYRWPDERQEKSQGETAPFLLYTAIENPVHISLFVTTVAQIIEKLPEAIRWQFDEEELSDDDVEAEVTAVLKLLSETDIEMFGKWDEKTLRQRSEVALIPQPVLKNLSGDPANPDWGLRWDPNRLDWSQFLGTDGAIRRAFAGLIKAIDLANSEAEEVTLTRGDALLVDNLRAMVRRRELGPEGAPYENSLFDYPEAWWLNVYYGFRKSAKPDFLGI
ncbi:hypothetical protein HK107_14915 [Parvularcula sp. ZS-1/3]|uniref:Uncharacterized protein n=1 Tax=Parvularcula mediterranea TaxID=2732508 RepID=A0A7Y3RQ17_9PROT|nr:hypothetical protein [Parvularcula mediterranea]NNU17621.1 hypothetical protein [Parvularcula mediterranea]